MAILQDAAVKADSATSISEQNATQNYTGTDPLGPPANPDHVFETRSRKAKKSYYDRIIEAFARETSSDVRRKVFGSDPLRS